MIPLPSLPTDLSPDKVVYAIVRKQKHNSLGRAYTLNDPKEIHVLPLVITGLHLEYDFTSSISTAPAPVWTVNGIEYRADGTTDGIRMVSGIPVEDCFTNLIEANVTCVRRINDIAGEMGVILEMCPDCQEEVIIYNDGITPCPACGAPMAPCSICGDCATSICPYGCTGTDDKNQLKPTNPVVPTATQEKAMKQYAKTLRQKPRLSGAALSAKRLSNIKSFVRFEARTAIIYPWHTPPEDILSDDKKLKQIAKALHWKDGLSYDTDELYDLLDAAFGVNPNPRRTAK